MSPRHMGMNLKLGLVLDTEVKCRPNNFLQLCLIPGKVKDSSRGAIYNYFLTSFSVNKLPFCLKNSTPYQSQWERENIFHYGHGKGQMSAVPASLRARGRQVIWLPCLGPVGRMTQRQGLLGLHSGMCVYWGKLGERGLATGSCSLLGDASGLSSWCMASFWCPARALRAAGSSQDSVEMGLGAQFGLQPLAWFLTQRVAF